MDEGNEVTYALGTFFNKVEDLLNKTVWRKVPHKIEFTHQFAMKYASFKENVTVIGRSLSYGLVSFCLGLCATLLYLLISAFL